MRVIQLGFQLHLPYVLESLGLDASKTADEAAERAFGEANQQIFQPLFALLERNIQKHRDFHFTLMISGPWLEQAEKYDSELVRRLQAMVKTGQVELVALPYYHSLAFFYAPDELAEQIRMYQEKLERIFGVTGRILALPELIYNDRIGRWAEDFGFAGVLCGSSERALRWHNSGHVYEAAGCQYLRLLVQNERITELIEEGADELMTEKAIRDEMKAGGRTELSFSAPKLQKILELEALRGGLINLYFDAGLLVRQREKGIIGLFDSLIEDWLKDERNKFATAAEACVVETPTMELDVLEAVSWENDEAEETSASLVRRSDMERRLPLWLNRKDQLAVDELIYGARKEILAATDERLSTALRRLMLVDYHKSVDSSVMAKLTEIIQDLKQRSAEIKKQQAVEISRNFTKRAEAEQAVSEPKIETTQNIGVAIEMDADDGTEVAVSGLKQVEQETPKPRGIRKIVRRLVIE